MPRSVAESVQTGKMVVSAVTESMHVRMHDWHGSHSLALFAMHAKDSPSTSPEVFHRATRAIFRKKRHRLKLPLHIAIKIHDEDQETSAVVFMASNRN